MGGSGREGRRKDGGKEGDGVLEMVVVGGIYYAMASRLLSE